MGGPDDTWKEGLCFWQTKKRDFRIKCLFVKEKFVHTTGVVSLFAESVKSSFVFSTKKEGEG